jgi:polyisoprenyl-phosphate glycosyltransferase
MRKIIKLSVIVPCYNEELNLIEFFNRLLKSIKKLSINYKIYFIDDGSIDNTWNVLKTIVSNYKHVVAIKFSRNFGHQYAINAGFQDAESEYVLILDADLQDPPELLLDMYKKITKGKLNVVYAKRKKSKESFLKKYTSVFFYKIFNLISDLKIPENTSDFRIIDKKVLKEIKKISEKDPFYRALIPWMGFKSGMIEFERPNRKKGQSGYNYLKSFNMGLSGILNFSNFPIRLSFFLSIITSLIFIITCFYTLYFYITEKVVQSWASIFLIICFSNIIIFFLIGIMSEYIGKIHREIKNYPNFIIDEKIEKVKNTKK